MSVEYQCAECGDVITPDTMNSQGCALFADGWHCGTCQSSVPKSLCTHPEKHRFTEPARPLNETSHISARSGCLACDTWFEEARVVQGAIGDAS
jgi:hypothetical protein